MRLLILTLAVLGLALPAFADCGANHQASSSNTTASKSAPSSTNDGG